MFRAPAQKILDLQDVTKRYYYKLISEAVSEMENGASFWNQYVYPLQCLEATITSINNNSQGRLGRDLRKSFDSAATDLGAQEATQRNILETQVKTTLLPCIKDKKLVQKIQALQRLREHLYSNTDEQAKLDHFKRQLNEDNQILRVHRNPGWDLFYNLAFIPFAIFLSPMNYFNYGTWNLKVTDGEEMMAKANEIVLR